MPADRLHVLRLALVAGALLMIGVGVVIYLSSDEVLGAILAGAGVLDLATIPLVLRTMGSASRRSQPPGEDPGYNPYAKED